MLYLNFFYLGTEGSIHESMGEFVYFGEFLAFGCLVYSFFFDDLLCLRLGKEPKMGDL
jgi:hypothetical protein